MKFSCERRQLLDALALAARLAERRSTIPILTHVKLATGKGKIQVTGTNLDRIAAAELPAAIATAGATTVNADLLLGFVKNAPDGSQVEIEAADDGGRMIVRAGRGRATLNTLPADGFPDFSEGEFDTEIEIPPEDLEAAIAAVAHAVGNEETRAYFTGIYLTTIEGDILAVGCDGFSLATRRVRLKDDVAFEPVIVPRQALDDIRRIAGAASTPVRIEISEARVRVSSGGQRLSSKLVEGVYPDIQRIIPEASPHRFSAGRVALETAVARCAAIADGKDHSIRVETVGNAVRIVGRNTDAGEIVDEIDAKAEGGDAVFFVNSVRLGEALAALACPEVRVEFGGELPIVLRNPDEPDVLQLVGTLKG